MRVVHMVSSSPYGGMQRLVAQLTEEQRHRGYLPHVVALYESEIFAQDLRHRGVEFSMTPGTKPSTEGPIALVRLLRRLKPEIVHLHGGLLWPRATALLVKGQPWIQHVHSYPECTRGVRGWMIQRVDARLCDAYISISESVARAVRCSFSGRGKPVYTVYNGIPTDVKILDSPTNIASAPVYGMATRFAPDKGIREFISVAREIVKLQPGAQFVLAGDGPLLSEIKAQVSDLKWNGRFALPGHVTDVEAFWRSIDVAVFTAPKEPLGLRILEPMALGIPVAAFRTGYGSDELIEDGVTGVQAPWGDSRALANRAVALTTNRAEWKRVSTAAACIVRERFSLAAMCDRIESVYNDVVGMPVSHRGARS